MINYVIIFSFLFGVEIFYLKIAARKGIQDTPNHRSAHVKPTIRGGGIIFIPAVFLFLFFFPNESSNYYFLIISILLVSIISFIDDLITLTSYKRILVHFIAFTLVFYHLEFFNNLSIVSVGLIFLSYVFSLGYLNIYNFMDGINGITFLNALISYITFFIINMYVVEFTSYNLLLILIFTTLIFGFFNFRIRPKCFAGDVGSITIGFTIIYFIVKLFLESNNYIVFLMLGVYLLDGGWTIFERIVRKENILEAHKRHLYQLLANDLKIPHLKISLIYFLVQLILNAIIIFYLVFNINSSLTFGIITFIVLSAIYIIIKRRVYNNVKKLRGYNEH